MAAAWSSTCCVAPGLLLCAVPDSIGSHTRSHPTHTAQHQRKLSSRTGSFLSSLAVWPSVEACLEAEQRHSLMLLAADDLLYPILMPSGWCQSRQDKGLHLFQPAWLMRRMIHRLAAGR